jgi:hypothetical protein
MSAMKTNSSQDFSSVLGYIRRLLRLGTRKRVPRSICSVLPAWSVPPGKGGGCHRLVLHDQDQ